MNLILAPVLFVLGIVGGIVLSVFNFFVRIFVGIFTAVATVVLAAWVVVNLAGLAGAIPQSSNFCRAYNNHTQTRLERSVLSAEIACKQGGLLVPAAKRAVTWLNERENRGLTSK